MQACLGLCMMQKLDGDSLVQYLTTAKQSFTQTSNDEFGQSLIEAFWIKQAETPKERLNDFLNVFKPILPQLIQKEVVSTEDCICFLESDLLAACSIVRYSKPQFVQLSNKTNT